MNRMPATGKIFETKSDILADLLPMIPKHHAVLPNFQREYVWSPDDVRDLLVSVAFRYPAGSLLTMPYSNDKFSVRSFTGTPPLQSDSSAQLMVLDGQQRLTSLYQSIYSEDGLHDGKGRQYFFYLDADLLMNDEDGSFSEGEPLFEQSLFYVEQRNGKRQRFADFRVDLDLTTPEMELQKGKLPLHLTFRHEALAKWREKYIQCRLSEGASFAEGIAIQNKWEQLVDPWLKQLREYPFPIVELHRDVPLPAICHIFEKVNSTGKPLTVFELCTAILWSKGVHLNELWRATQQRLHEEHLLRMQGELDGTHFLQVIALLDSLDRKLASPNARIAVSCRRDELTRLTADTVNRWWPVAEDAYREASFFMEEEGIVASQILPYSTIIVPLAGLIGSIKFHGGSSALGASREKISQWYWCSVFSGRYSGPVDTNAGKDTEQVFHWVNGIKEPDVVRDFSFQANRLEQAKSIRGVLYKGVLCLLARNNARDFSGGGKLTTNLYKKTSQHHHHIFPRSAVKKLGVADDRTESIINMTLISAAANLRISGQLPSHYVAKMRAELGEANANEILLSHAIVPDLLATDDWDQFMLARRELLLNLIVDATGKLAVPFSDGREAPIELHLQTIAADIESIEIRLRDLVALHLCEDRSRINGYELDKIKERYESTRRRTPGMKEFHQIGVRELLDYADIRILESIIKAKDNWLIFTDFFGNKTVFESRFTGLANVRNALAHNRQPNEFEIGDGRTAALWFNRVLDNALIQPQIEIDAHIDYEPEDDGLVDDTVDVQSIVSQHYLGN